MRLHARFLLSLVVVVVSCLAGGAGQQPTVNLQAGTNASDPNLPEVHATVDRRRVRLGTQVTFTVSPASVVNDRQYVVTLNFGDDRQEVMHTPQTIHLYPAVGTYTYSVTVKRSRPPNSTPTPTPTLTPTPPPTPRPSPQPVPQVSLVVSPIPAQQGEQVNFAAQLSGSYPNVRYRFAFGDGRSSRWQRSPQAQHTYARPGNYFAYVDIANPNQRVGGSERKRVDVMPPLSVSVTARPLPAQSGKPVNFIAGVSSFSSGTRYRFNFGDGAPSFWQTDREAQHSYNSAGNYRAVVQVSQSVGNRTLTATSGPTLVTVQTTVTPTPQPTTPTPEISPSESPSPNTSPSSGPDGAISSSDSPTSNQITRTLSSRTWWYFLIAAALLFLIYKGTGYLLAAKPTFEPFSDPGVAGLADEKGLLPLDFQLVLNPNVSAGDYSVQTPEQSLVTNAGRFDDRQVFEI